MSDNPLALPDPDPDALAEVEPSQLTPSDEAACAHLVRAILKAEASLTRLEQARQKDLEAWNQMIGAHKSRVLVWRMIVRDWMLRQNVPKLQTPWFTAAIATPRPKIVVLDEEALKGKLTGAFAGAGTRLQVILWKREFDDIYNAQPNAFEGLAHEEQGEAELRIRKREEK